jgi:L-ascorbate metabolism protein UlaG (beta-lactamase superfamily)
MVITYHGAQSFRITFGDLVLAYNPVSRESEFKAGKFGSNLVLVSLNHPDFNGVEQVTYGEKEPFVIDGAGEYEIDNISIRGMPVNVSYRGGDKINTIYTVLLEGMKLCFLGTLTSSSLSTSVRGSLGSIDILFIPVGGGDVLQPARAHELAVELGAKIIIPMHYAQMSLKTFLKEEDVKNGAPVERLTLKKKDIEEKEGEIVVLSAKSQ